MIQLSCYNDNPINIQSLKQKCTLHTVHIVCAIWSETLIFGVEYK